MKAISLPTYLAAVLQAVSASAQQSNPDPFDKKQAPPPAAQAEAGPPEVLGVRFVAESYRVPASWFTDLIGQGKTDAELYAAVLDAAGREDARVALAQVQSITAQPGNRARVSSFDVAATPAGFKDSHPPGAMMEISTGDMMELESVIDSDGIGVHLNFSLEHSRLSGFYTLRSSGDVAGRMTPRIAQRVINQGLTLASGKPALAGVASETGEAGGSHLVASFLMPSMLKDDKATQIIEGRWQLALTVWRLDATEARRLIATHLADDAALLGEMRRLGSLETLLAAECKSGQRAAIASREQITSVTTAVPAGAGGITFESNDLGWRVEFDPVLSNDRDRVQVSLNLEHGAFRGDLEVPGGLSHTPSQPVLAFRRLSSSAMLIPGQPRFLGTLNEPGDTGVNGRQPSGEASLVFLELRLP